MRTCKVRGMTQTRREYAASLGLAIAGARGKFSKDAVAAIDKARAEGMVFSDDNAPVRTARPATVTDTTTESVTRIPSASESAYLFPSDFRFPEGEYRAVAHIDGKRKVFGMREVCNNCRVSLVMCACANPTIYGNVVVKLERTVSASTHQ